MLRQWDVAYDGYCGGKGCQVMNWDDPGVNSVKDALQDNTREYDAASVIAIGLYHAYDWLPSPLVMMPSDTSAGVDALLSPEAFVRNTKQFQQNITKRISDPTARQHLEDAISTMYNNLDMHAEGQIVKTAQDAAQSNESTTSKLMYQGTSTWNYGAKGKVPYHGCGHHGPDYVGVASARNGKSMMSTGLPAISVSAPKIA